MRTIRALLVLATAIGLMGLFPMGTAFAQVRGRMPVGPGNWYPEDPAQLFQDVTRYIEEADVSERNVRLAAIIAPNEAYDRSGKVAGHAYKLLKPGKYDRVIVLSPAHSTRFQGCSMPSVQFYRTPLGDILTDMEAMERLNRSSLINMRSVRYNVRGSARQQRVPIHEVEHGIEVQLPFLQVQLGEFKLVPVVVGDLVDHRGRIDEGAVESVANVMSRIVDDRTLIVVSTNFTRHGPRHGNIRYRSNVLQGINQDDMRIFERILNRDIGGFHRVVEEQGDAVTGRAAIALLMHLLPQRASGVVLSHDTSGRISGDSTNSTSYAAIAFFEPGSPPNAQREVRTLVPRTPRSDESTGSDGPASDEVEDTNDRD